MSAAPAYKPIIHFRRHALAEPWRVNSPRRRAFLLDALSRSAMMLLAGPAYQVRPESTSPVFRPGSTRLPISSHEPIGRAHLEWVVPTLRLIRDVMPRMARVARHAGHLGTLRLESPAACLSCRNQSPRSGCESGRWRPPEKSRRGTARR